MAFEDVDWGAFGDDDIDAEIRRIIEAQRKMREREEKMRALGAEPGLNEGSATVDDILKYGAHRPTAEGPGLVPLAAAHLAQSSVPNMSRGVRNLIESATELPDEPSFFDYLQKSIVESNPVMRYGMEATGRLADVLSPDAEAVLDQAAEARALEDSPLTAALKDRAGAGLAEAPGLLIGTPARAVVGLGSKIAPVIARVAPGIATRAGQVLASGGIGAAEGAVANTLDTLGRGGDPLEAMQQGGAIGAGLGLLTGGLVKPSAVQAATDAAGGFFDNLVNPSKIGDEIRAEAAAKAERLAVEKAAAEAQARALEIDSAKEVARRLEAELEQLMGVAPDGLPALTDDLAPLPPIVTDSPVQIVDAVADSVRQSLEAERVDLRGGSRTRPPDHGAEAIAEEYRGPVIPKSQRGHLPANQRAFKSAAEREAFLAQLSDAVEAHVVYEKMFGEGGPNLLALADELESAGEALPPLTEAAPPQALDATVVASEIFKEGGPSPLALADEIEAADGLAVAAANRADEVRAQLAEVRKKLPPEELAQEPVLRTPEEIAEDLARLARGEVDESPPSGGGFFDQLDEAEPPQGSRLTPDEQAIKAETDVAYIATETKKARMTPGVVATAIRVFDYITGGGLSSAQTLADTMTGMRVQKERLGVLLKEMVGGETAVLANRIRVAERDFDTAVRQQAKATGVTPEEIRAQVRKARITGNPDALPAHLRPAYDNVTKHIDDMSATLAGLLPGNTNLAKSIADNIGSYLMRQFDIFDLPPDMRAKALSGAPAKRLFDQIKASDPTRPDQEILGLMFNLVANGVKDVDAAAKVFGVSPKNLRQRKNLTPALREFLGESNDFSKLIKQTAHHTARGIAWLKTMNNLKESALAAGTARDAPWFDQATGKGYVPIEAAAPSAMGNPFEGLYFHEDVARVVNQAFEADRLVDDLPRFLSLATAYNAAKVPANAAKLMLTAFNRGSYINNALGAAISYVSASGVGGIKTALKHVPTVLRLTAHGGIAGTTVEKALVEAVGAEYAKRFNDGAYRQRFEWMLKNGIIGGGAVMFDIGGADKRRIVKSKITAPLQDARDATVDAARRAFGSVDNFFRIMRTFDEAEKQAAIAGTAVDNAAWDRAAGIVKDTMPTFSRVANWAKEWSAFPVIAPFFAIQAEVARNALMTVKYGARDIVQGMRSGNMRQAAVGGDRILGAGVAAYGMISYLQNRANEEEGITPEQRDAMASLLAYDFENPSQLVLGNYRPGTGATVSNPGRYRPTELIERIFELSVGIANQDPEAVSKFADGVLGLEPFAQGVVEAATDRQWRGYAQPAGGPVMGQDTGRMARAEAVLKETTTRGQRETVSGLWEMLSAKLEGVEYEPKPEIKSGERTIERMVPGKIARIADEWNSRHGNLVKYRNAIKHGYEFSGIPLTANQWAEERRMLSENWKNTYADAVNLAAKMRLVGMSDAQIRAMFKKSNFTVRAVDAIVAGTNPDVTEIYDLKTGEARGK